VSVLVAISDLFFSSKIDAVSKDAARAKRGVDLVAQVKAAMPKRLVVELGSKGYGVPAIDAIRALKSDEATRGVEIVGYCRHTEIDLIRAARAAGADRVLTQGEFAELLPSLLDEKAALPRGAASCE
jgi:hypothetical protein